MARPDSFLKWQEAAARPSAGLEHCGHASARTSLGCSVSSAQRVVLHGHTAASGSSELEAGVGVRGGGEDGAVTCE